MEPGKKFNPREFPDKPECMRGSFTDSRRRDFLRRRSPRIRLLREMRGVRTGTDSRAASRHCRTRRWLITMLWGRLLSAWSLAQQAACRERPFTPGSSGRSLRYASWRCSLRIVSASFRRARLISLNSAVLPSMSDVLGTSSEARFSKQKEKRACVISARLRVIR
ncbi:hypothetical protein SAMN05216315_10987 [Nitrosospira sp. Nsp18]|nr:hypothetical protein SAMN05216315_10987 [Nitrosospira sp. Nsp18]